MLAGCHISKDIRRHRCYLHEQDMCLVDISVDMQVLADMGGDELVVMSLDVRCNRYRDRMSRNVQGSLMRCEKVALCLHADVGKVHRRYIVHIQRCN